MDASPAGPAALAGTDKTEETAPAAETPQRWTGAAAVPAAESRKAMRNRRRFGGPEQPAPAADPWAGTAERPGEPDWSHTAPVDPWADHDTPIDVFEPFPEALPPTRIDPPATMPPTRIDAPAATPPTRIDRPATAAPAPPPAPAQAPAAPAAAPPGPPTPAAAPAPGAAAPGPARRSWFKRKEKPATAAAADRVPVQPARPATPPLPPAYAKRAKPPAKPTAQPPTRPAGNGRPGKGLPPPRPRKRRWGRRLLLFTLLSTLCCCGVPAYFAWPAARQFPVTATLPATIADLSLRDDGTSRSAVERLTEQVRGTTLLGGGEPFAGVYADGDGKRVTVFGTTGFRFTPESDVEDQLARLAGDYDFGEIGVYDLGVTGAHERCGTGSSEGDTVVVCAWADRGSLAAAVFTRRSADESAALTGTLREEILTPRWGGDLPPIL